MVASAVGYRTPVWMMHADRKLKQCGAPPPPGGDWPGLNAPQHTTSEPVTGATMNVHQSENKQKRRRLKE